MQDRFLSAIESKVGQSVRTVFTNEAFRTLHTLFPNSFEYYLLAFEVVNSKNQVVQRMAFPVMPKSMSINKVPIKQVRKTFSGVSVLVNSSFVPYDLQIQGTFGRSIKMKVALTDSEIRETVSAVRQFAQDAVDLRLFQDFNADFNTGFGYTKKLERIIQLSDSLDEFGKPYRCIMYNLAFNEVVYVEFMNSSFSQTEETSRMWQYQIGIKAVSPIKTIRERIGSAVSDLISGNVDSVNDTVRAVSSAFTSGSGSVSFRP